MGKEVHDVYGDLFGSSAASNIPDLKKTDSRRTGSAGTADAAESLRKAEEALNEVERTFGSLYSSNNDRIKEIMDEVDRDFGITKGAERTGSGADSGTADPSGIENGESGEIKETAESEASAGESVNQAQQTAAATEAAPAEPETDPMEDLNELIGLRSIKHDVKELYDFTKVQKLRADAGMKTVPVSKHLVFSGNPGTGKTTVARILARLYKQIGVLSGGQLVETDRSGLVAGYVGQTAVKTQQKIKEAMGGVLFIDEAYALARNESGQDFGQEAIDTLLKAMEDHRDDLIVIVAGYTGPMKTFVESNPGLKSRFNKFIEFPDYTIDELMAIFDLDLKKYQYVIDEDAREQVKTLIMLDKAKNTENFANARAVRNLFESIITNQARRISLMEAPTPEDMQRIMAEDLRDDEKEDTAKTEDADVSKDTANTADAAGSGDAAKAADAAGSEDTAKAEDTAGSGDAAKAADEAGNGDAAKAEDAAGSGDAAKAADAAGSETAENMEE